MKKYAKFRGLSFVGLSIVLGMILDVAQVQAAPTFVFAQKAAFERGQTPVDVHAVRWGFVRHLGDAWQAERLTAVIYDVGRDLTQSQEMRFEIPEAYAGWVIAYRIGAKADGWQGKQEFWSEERFINPKSPEGSFVSLPIRNSAHYDFTPEYFDLQACPYVVQQLSRTEQEWEIAECPYWTQGAKLSEVFYGFTVESHADAGSRSVSWWNSFGEPSAEGSIQVWGERHNNGYKGTMFRVLPYWVRVPQGMNLIYRARYQDSKTGTMAETSEFFVDVRAVK